MVLFSRIGGSYPQRDKGVLSLAKTKDKGVLSPVDKGVLSPVDKGVLSSVGSYYAFNFINLLFFFIWFCIWLFHISSSYYIDVYTYSSDNHINNKIYTYS